MKKSVVSILSILLIGLFLFVGDAFSENIPDTSKEISVIDGEPLDDILDTTEVGRKPKKAIRSGKKTDASIEISVIDGEPLEDELDTMHDKMKSKIKPKKASGSKALLKRIPSDKTKKNSIVNP